MLQEVLDTICIEWKYNRWIIVPRRMFEIVWRIGISQAKLW